MDSKLEQLYRSQITQLEEKVTELEDERLNKNMYEMEKQNIALERERLILLDENNQLKFKNKVLMAMCTISEVRGDRGDKQTMILDGKGVQHRECVGGLRSASRHDTNRHIRIPPHSRPQCTCKLLIVHLCYSLFAPACVFPG